LLVIISFFNNQEEYFWSKFIYLFISPEEFIEEFYDPEKVDVWSSAIIFYEILYVATPWEIAYTTDCRFNIFLKCYRNNKAYVFLKNI